MVNEQFVAGIMAARQRTGEIEGEKFLHLRKEARKILFGITGKTSVDDFKEV
jgi:hypothetical protein